MPIQITCECSKTLRVKDELAGKKVRCPGCSEILVVPPADDAVVPVLELAPPRVIPPPLRFDEDDEQTAVTDKPTVKIPGKSTYDTEDEDDDRQRSKFRDRDDEDEDDRPVKRKRRRRSADRLHTSQGGAMNAVLAGIGLMVAGVVLFVGPLAFGCFWPYSIIIFIAGVLSVIRGALQK